MEKHFPVYRGLQRPLTYKGFKGKYIYWGVGILLLSLVLGALSMALINMYVGATLMILLIIAGFFYIGLRQERGLHDKTSSKGIYLHINHLSKINLYGKAKRI
ncbi:plasmid transfer protein [Pedobacter sp. MW01-1-1]|uniref:plasmid transfer protein n=1 Tax=Pedobacter sp. MW01-1-1 TaxID=3383027 RepID=UPI003FEF8E55